MTAHRSYNIGLHMAPLLQLPPVLLGPIEHVAARAPDDIGQLGCPSLDEIQLEVPGELQSRRLANRAHLEELCRPTTVVVFCKARP